MAKISDIMRETRVLSVDAEQTVIEAARLMTEFNIGAVPVLRGGELIGIFSERDLMRRVVAGGRSPATRLITISTKPSMSSPLRGFIRPQISGQAARRFTGFFFGFSGFACAGLAIRIGRTAGLRRCNISPPRDSRLSSPLAEVSRASLPG